MKRTVGRPRLKPLTEKEVTPYVLEFLSKNKDVSLKDVTTALKKSLRKKLHKNDFELVNGNIPRFEKIISNVFSHGKINIYLHVTKNLFNNRTKFYKLNNRGLEYVKTYKESLK